jgi:hypothetical protein
LSHAAGVGAQQPAQRRPSSTQQAVTAVRRATVTISVTRPDSQGLGSGFVVTSDGVIATAAHVIRGATTASVRLPSGESYDVQGVIAIDEPRDFALVRIAGFGLPTVALGNSDSVPVGSHLFAFGAPLGFEATVSDGLLSASRLREGTRLFQISIPISPGSSGGPVATDDGMVVGIVVATWKEEGAQNLNFALPINYLRGQIPLASAKTPLPLSQMSYQPSPAAGEAAPAAVGLPAGTPARVNDSLGIDWKVLDGAQVRVETKGDQGARRTSIAEYSLSRTPQGDQGLERTTVERAWQTGDIFSGRKGGTWYEDNTRTVIGLGSSRVEFYWRRSPASNQIPPGSLTLTIDGGMVVVDSGSIHRTAVLPRGALPAALLGAVVAALPDSLPSSVYVWFFSPSNASVRAEPVRIDFANSERMKVQIARPGTHCSMNSVDENTEGVTVDALQMTATVGPDRLTWPILAQRPHLRLDTKCLRVPNFERRKD